MKRLGHGTAGGECLDGIRSTIIPVELESVMYDTRLHGTINQDSLQASIASMIIMKIPNPASLHPTNYLSTAISAARYTQSIAVIFTGAPSAIAATELCRSEEHTSELQSRRDLVCRLLLEKK